MGEDHWTYYTVQEGILGVLLAFSESSVAGNSLAFTVKIATQTVARMKLLDDLNSNNQGFLRASLSILSISPAMTRFHTQGKANADRQIKTVKQERVILKRGKINEPRPQIHNASEI